MKLGPALWSCGLFPKFVPALFLIISFSDLLSLLPPMQMGESGTFPRSGNPGYVVGKPLLAGNLVRQVVDGITRYHITI